MTDEQIVAAAATKVMGFVEAPARIRVTQMPIGQFIIHEGVLCLNANNHSYFAERWNPLVNEEDCASVLDKLADKFPSVFVSGDRSSTTGAYWSCEIYVQGSEGMDRVGMQEIDGLTPESRRRAIVMAALRACGVEV